MLETAKKSINTKWVTEGILTQWNTIPATKRNKPQLHAVTWMPPQTLILSKRSQDTEDCVLPTPFIKASKTR